MLAVIKTTNKNKIQIHTGEEVTLGAGDQLVVGIDGYLIDFYSRKQSSTVQVSFEPLFYLSKNAKEKIQEVNPKEDIKEEVKVEKAKEVTIEKKVETKNKEEVKVEEEKPADKKEEPKKE